MWSENVEIFDPYNNILGDTQDEIRKLFRDWMIFIICIDLFLIAFGVTMFIMRDGWQRWFNLALTVIPAAWCTRHTIRSYKGEI